MDAFVFSRSTKIICEVDAQPVSRAVSILRRDMDAVLTGYAQENEIVLTENASLAPGSTMVP